MTGSTEHSEKEPFQLWIGESTGILAKLKHSQGMPSGKDIVLGLRDACRGFNILGDLGTGKTTRIVSVLALQALTFDAGALIFDIRGDYGVTVERMAAITRKTVNRIGVGHLSVNLIEGLTPDTVAGVLENAFKLQGQGRGESGFWTSSAKDRCKFALAILQHAEGNRKHYNLSSLYSFVFNPDFQTKALSNAKGYLHTSKRMVLQLSQTGETGETSPETENAHQEQRPSTTVLKQCDSTFNLFLKELKSSDTPPQSITILIKGREYEIIPNDDLVGNAPRASDCVSIGLHDKSDASRKANELLPNTNDVRRLQSAIEYEEFVFPTYDEKVRNGIKSTIATVLTNFSDPEIEDAFCISGPSHANIADVLDGAVFIVNVPREQFMSAASVVYLFIKQRYFQAINSRAAMPPGPRRERPVLFICDEYQDIVSIGDNRFFSMSRALNSIGIIASQSVEAYREALGSNYAADALLNNFAQIIMFRSSPETMRFLSERLGTTIVPTESFSTNWPSGLFNSPSKGKTIGEQRVPVLDAQTFCQTRPEEAIARLSIDGEQCDDVIRLLQITDDQLVKS